jgi:hypothetical protein
MNKFRNILRKLDKSILVVALITILLIITNYTKGAYLLGWDNLQTDLNPLLGVKRALFAVWQEYQSFGLLTGMAHAADLVRASAILLMSYILPSNTIRLIFHMGMFFVGGFGTLLLLRHAGFNGEKKLFSLIGAIFYILNFSIIQMMFLPFESFSVFFGLLPLEIWIFIKTIENKSTFYRNLLLLAIINLLATPQSVSQQLFVVYILILLLFSIGIYLQEKTIRIIKNSAIIFAVIFLVNSFWLIPQIYAFKNSISSVKYAKINQTASIDLFYNNKDKGNLKDFLSSTGFLYDRLDKNQKPIFAAWKDYRDNSTVMSFVYLLSFVCLIGIFRKTKFHTAFLLNYFLVAVALLIDTPPFNFINQALRQNSTVNELFRSPFTKFAIPYALVSSYLFANGASFLFDLIKRNKLVRKTINIYVYCGIIGILILITSLPAFQGNYTSKEMRIKIPQEYFDLFTYFKAQDKNQRIAVFPDYSFWGWFYNDWGYDGSGFLWYGIEQPMISRTFDVWSNTSESYYWEMQNALQKEDKETFNKILEKYDIDYILTDDSLRPVAGNAKNSQKEKLKVFLSENNKTLPIKKMNFLTIYKVNHDKNIKDFVWISGNHLLNIGPNIQITQEDTAYLMDGDYVTNPSQPYDKYYPFLDLTTQSWATQSQWSLFELDSEWKVIKNLPFDFQNYKLSSKSADIPIDLYLNNSAVKFIFPFSAQNSGKRLSVQFPKIQVKSFDLKDTEIKSCTKTNAKIEYEKSPKSLTIGTKNNVNGCFSYSDNNLDEKYGYIVKVESHNITGKPLLFYISDMTNNQTDIEDLLRNDLQYYVLDSKNNHGIGYNFGFQNNAYANISSTNNLSNLSVYLMPYDNIKQLFLSSMNSPQTTIAPSPSEFTAQKMNYFTYFVNIDKKNSPFLVLNQSYSLGWKAYEIENVNWLNSIFPSLSGKELKEHVLVNNWANGWILNKTERDNLKIVIIFWPQYLEYLGFGVLIGTFVWILISARKKEGF